MKHNAIRMIVAVLLLCAILLPMANPVTVGAASTTLDSLNNRYNIMLVIDGTGSLQWSPGTDKNGMRYEFIDEIFANLADDGHHIGAIVFGGNNTDNPSDEAMKKGILMQTDIMSLDEPAPGGNRVKYYLSEQIRGAGVDHSMPGQTDIGTALLIAERELQKKQKENGLESVIFLLTDGCTKIMYTSVYNKSLENATQATYEMSKNNIRLFGVFLNQGDGLDDSEIAGLVCSANGIRRESQEFKDSFVEINDAKTFHRATATLLRFLGLTGGQPPISIIDEYHGTFSIPGIGVEEMNIRLFTDDGSKLPNMTIEITRPDGYVLTGAELETLGWSSNTFRVYKLIDPMPGDWSLHIKAEKGNKVEFYFTPVYSFQVDALLDVSPAVSALHANMDADFTAQLAQGGTPITDPGAYRGYECRLEIVDVTTGAPQTFQVSPNNNRALVQTVPLTYGKYEARAVFTCGDLVVSSAPIELDLPNHAPAPKGYPNFKLKYGLFQDKTTDIDLTAYAEDLEDGSNLIFRIGSAAIDPAALQLQGNILRVDNARIGDNSVPIFVSDTMGSEIEITFLFETTNMTIIYIICLILLIILIAAIVIFLAWSKGKIKPRGILNLTFDMEVGSKEHNILLELDIPGVHTTSNTSLQKLLRSALRFEDREVARGVYASDVTDYISQYAGELSKVTLSVARKRKGSKTMGAVRVAYGKNSSILFGSAWDVRVGDAVFTLEYLPEDIQDSNPFNDPFATSAAAPDKKGDDNLFDDLF